MTPDAAQTYRKLQSGKWQELSIEQLARCFVQLMLLAKSMGIYMAIGSKDGWVANQ